MTELEQLEKALEKFFTNNPNPSNESVFNEGVKFGIAMQASNNLDYESTYWMDAKERLRIKEELSQLCGDVSKKILKFWFMLSNSKLKNNLIGVLKSNTVNYVMVDLMQV